MTAPATVQDEREALRLVGEALELPEADREAWLTAQTGGRLGLRHKVQAMLAADAALETAEAEAEAQVSGANSSMAMQEEAPSSDLAARPHGLPWPRRASRALPPRQIGPWQLEELIGAGGMGSVYRAERCDGLFQQTVAIKFIRALDAAAPAGSGPDGPTVQALIDAERRTLARMEHPRIARILDAGVTNNGLQFLVMEFVQGEAIDEYVHAQQLPLRGRVALMRSVCAAVAHAHQNMVLHCDLKPANILVAADGRPKLIDFGVARLQDLTMAALPEGMTRAYSSPERLAGMPATPSDDVFALGLVLQELLGIAERKAASDPDAPTRVPVPLDLQAVVRRAHAPERAHRYSTVEAFDEDLRRWLDVEPVAAAEGGWPYRLAKLTQRHPVAMASGALVLVGLVGTLALITTLYSRAEHQRERAEARFGELRSFSPYVLFELDRQLEELPGSTRIRRDVVARGQQHLESLAASAGDNDEVLREAAVGTARLAELQGGIGMANLGDSVSSRNNFQRTEKRLQSLLQRAPDDWTLMRDLGRVQVRLADLYGFVANDEEARLAKFQEAERHLVAALQALRSPDPSMRVDLEALLSAARIGQSAAQDYLGQSALGAQRARAEELRLAALPAELASHERVQERLARAATQHGDSLFFLDRHAESIESYRRALAIFDRALPQRPTDRRLRQGATLAHWGASAALLSLAQPSEAAWHSARSLDMARELAAADAEDMNLAIMLSTMVAHHARALGASGRRGEAVELLTADIERREARLRLHPDDGLALRNAAVPLRLLADLLWDSGNAAGACAIGGKAERAWDALDRLSPLAPLDRKNEDAQRQKHATRCAG